MYFDVMKIRFALCLFVAVLAHHPFADITSNTRAVEAPLHAAGGTILVLGDSISAGYGIQRDAGWVALLEQRVASMQPPYRVVNASLSGETTGGGLARLPKALEIHTPSIVVIELGGNDALRGYPIPNIRHNLIELATLAQTAGARVVIVGMQIPPNYGSRYTQAFHQLYADVAEQKGATLIPFLLDGVATDATLMQPDGIHPKAEAQTRLLNNAWPAISELM
jgi:acyl-CoA thioesterase-1